MTSSYIKPLNLQYIFQNLLAGSPEIFMGVLFIGFSVLAGIFKMPKGVYALLIGLSGIFLYSWFNVGFYYFIVIIGSILIFYTISKVVKN